MENVVTVFHTHPPASVTAGAARVVGLKVLVVVVVVSTIRCARTYVVPKIGGRWGPTPLGSGRS